jgi:eukaryotic-like serine/threonine-protein kinase
MSSLQSNSGVVVELAEEFVDRYRKGQRPSLKEYIDRYPELAAEIKDVFPAMAMMENIAIADECLKLGPQPDEPAARSFEQLGDYRIIREIGHGGMGIVYEAEQVSLGRHVALKVLPNQALKDFKQKRRFEREARAAAKLHHTNIVPVFGVGEHDGLPYYVMQFIQGQGLEAVLGELNHFKPGGSATRFSDEIRLKRRGATAAQMARSLMTGAFPHGGESTESELTAGAETLGLNAPPGEQETEHLDDENAAPATSQEPTDPPRSGQHPDLSNLSASSLSLPGASGSVAGRKKASRRPTYWQSVANIGRQVADALDYAHKQGVLHRDVKPSNLLLDMRGTVWVTDFGLAKVAGPGAENLTHTGDILGTLRYMPAEAFEGKSDARSDVYSLGLTLYELLALRPAFDEKDRNKLIKQVTTAEPAPLDRVNREIPRDLVTIVQKAIEKEPARRYATAEELAADLQRYLDDEPILARRQTEVERWVRWARHHPGIAALGAVLASVLVMATIASVIVAGRMARTASNERWARGQADQAKKTAESSFLEAREAGRLARAAEEAGRKLLYTTDMRLAPFLWRDDRTTAEQLRVLLAKHIPDRQAAGKKEVMAAAPKPDLRGFEWHYYQHLLDHNALVFSGHTISVAGAAFTANGQLVTLDENDQVRRWDLDWQDEFTDGRRDLPGGYGAQARALSPDGRLAALAEGDKVRVFDTSSSKETFQINSANVDPRRLIFSQDGERLVIVDDGIRWLSASSGELIATFDRKFNRIVSLAMSADGLTLAVIGHGNTANLASIFRLDAAAKTVTPRARDFGAGATLHASALSPDGQRIAVGAHMSGSLFVFDTATGRLITEHGSGHASPIAAMAFSGDGANLATADAEGTIKIWADPEKLNSKTTALLTLKGHQGAIKSVHFSIDGKRLLTTSADKTARVWDLQNAGAAIRPLERARFNLLARFSPDGQLIAASNGRTVRLWDAATGRLVRELPAVEKGAISSVAFSPTDQHLLAVGYGGADPSSVSYVALWDIDAGTEQARLPGATDLPGFPADASDSVVGALAFSPDGKYLAAGFGSRTLIKSMSFHSPLKVWEVAKRRLICRLNGHTNYCVSLDFSRDGTLMASGSRDGTAIIWSTATWKATRTLQNPDQGDEFTRSSGIPVEDVAFSPDSNTLALASYEGTVQLWDVSTGKLLETLKGHSGGVSAVAFSPDGRTLASGSSDETVRLWNVETRRELMQLDSGSVKLGHVQSLAFSPDGQALLAGGGIAAFWSTAPTVWNDPDQAAEKLRMLLQTNAGFPSRIRMLSENLRLHEALAKLDSRDPRVQAGLAATQANWHASRKAWPDAVAACDRLLAADPTSPERWLRTPGLLRLAMALVQQNRPALAATLLQGGAKRRVFDGLPPVVNYAAFGVLSGAVDGQIRVSELLPGSPAARSTLVPGDVIVKINDIELTTESRTRWSELLGGGAGTKVRLTVRHSGSEKTEVVELTRARFMSDPATGEQLYPLQAAVDERLGMDPRDARLLELRAELAGQWSDAEAQVADYTAAVAALSQQKPAARAADLQRLYGRRGMAYVKLEKWQDAVDDFAHAVTDQTTDDLLLSNQALAMVHVLQPPERFVRLGRKNESNGIDLIDEADGVTEPAEVEGQECRRLMTNLQSDCYAYIIIQKGFKSAPTMDVQVGVEYWADDSGTLAIEYDSPASAYTPSPKTVGLGGPSGWKTERFVLKGARFAHSQNGQADLRIRAQTRGRLYLRRINLRRFIPGVEGDDPWVQLAAIYRSRNEWEAVDKLVASRPQSAGPIGDLFAAAADWRRAIALYSKVIAETTTDVELLSKRARAQEALKNWDAAAADWSRAATVNPDGAKWLAELARRLAGAGQSPMAKVQFEKSQALYEKSLEADPENDLIVPELAQLLLDKEANEKPIRWAVLKPTEMKSKGGATLTLKDDGSILASGKNPDRDVYTLVARPGLDHIIAIRLEALTDPTLPSSGPGRYPDSGCFHLNEWRAFSGGQPCTLTGIFVAYDEKQQYPKVIDGKIDESTGWSNWPRSGQATNAIVTTQLQRAAEDDLKIELYFSRVPEWTQHNLGCFRLSITGEPSAPVREQRRFAAMKVSDPWARLALAYAVNDRNDEASRYLSRALERADGYEARKSIVELASGFDGALSALIRRRPDDPQLQLALARKLAERGKLLLAEKQPAKARAELEKSRAIFTRLRADYPEAQWSVLTPTAINSNSGASFAVQNDRSVFVSGKHAIKDVYSVDFDGVAHELQAIRLEALSDERLPNGGPGTHSSGNFVLSEFKAFRSDETTSSGLRELAFRYAFATFQERPVQLSLEPGESGWSIHGGQGHSQSAYFVVAPDADSSGSNHLRILLDFSHVPTVGRGPAKLGRFRLSVTKDHGFPASEQLRADLMDSEIADLNVTLAKAYAQQVKPRPR